MKPALTLRSRQRLASAGLFSIAVFVGALLLLELFAFRSPPHHMSQFANSRFSGFWLVAIYSFILGMSMLGWALQPCLQACRSKRVGMAMLVLAWFGAVLLAAFPTDAVKPLTLRGAIHEDAALTMFVLLGAAMVVLAPAFRATPHLERFARVSFVLGVLVTVSWIIYLTTTLRDLTGRGPAQRILVTFIVVWFTLLALWLRKLPEPAPEPARRPGQRPSRAGVRHAKPAKARAAPAVRRARAHRSGY